jgi:hypothetical protein
MCVRPVAWPEPDPQVAAAIPAKYRVAAAVLIRDQRASGRVMRISRMRSGSGAGLAGLRRGWRW